MPKQPETITDILNQIWAMQTIRLVSLREIADNLKVNSRSISDWIMTRRRRPNGDAAFKLKNFAAMMTLKISKRPQLAKRYRAAFTAANVLFPVEGSGEK